jgi:hypothetical protein
MHKFGVNRMPFRDGDYEGVFDQATLKQLQAIFDDVWLVVTASKTPNSRDEIARLILEAHKEGHDAEGIKRRVIGALA